MRRLILPLSIVLAGVIPLVLGRLLAGWLMNGLAAEALWGWVLGMVVAVIFSLLLIAGVALYLDKVWRGLMHPLAFMGSVALLLIALLSLPSLWGQLQLIAEGKTALGTVEALATGLDYDPETNITHTIYYLSYGFTADTGESYRNRIRVSQAIYQTLDEEDDIGVVYLRDRPDYSLPEMVIEPERRARRVFMYLLAVFVVLGETAVIQFFWERGLEAFLARWD